MEKGVTVGTSENYVDKLISERWPKLTIPLNQERLLSSRVLKIETSVQKGNPRLKSTAIKGRDLDTLHAKLETGEYRPKLYLYDSFIRLNTLDKALIIVILAQRASGKYAPLVEVRATQDVDKTRREVDYFLNELYGGKSQMMELLDNYFG